MTGFMQEIPPLPVRGLAALDDVRSEARAALDRDGVVLLRGLCSSGEELAAAQELLLGPPMPYIQGNSPRTKLGRWYTATDYPGEYTISLHNELSYTSVYPEFLLFACVRPADEGGGTTIADGHKVLEELPEEVTVPFASGVRYLQNLHGGYGLGRSWQETFETTERSTVDKVLAERGAQWSWGLDDSLRIEQTRPSTLERRGVAVWFNQADQWHWSNLDEVTRESFRVLYDSEDEYPLHAVFADGSRIDPAALDVIRRTCQAHARPARWQPWDVMLVDNIACLHGRQPFRGQRDVRVAMSTEVRI